MYSAIPTLIASELIGAAVLSGTQVNLNRMAVGDGNGSPITPADDMTALVNEHGRWSLDSLERDVSHPSWLIATLIIPADQGGFTVREVGLFDDQDRLFAIGNFPETYKPLPSEGSIGELVIRMYVKVATTAPVTLVVDPNTAIASREWVINQINDLSLIDDQDEHLDKTYSSVKINSLVDGIVVEAPQSSLFTRGLFR